MLYVKQERWSEAREYLKISLHCEVIKDIITMSKFAHLVGLVLECSRMENDRDGIAEFIPDLYAGIQNLKKRRIHEDERESFGVLLSKIGLCLLAHGNHLDDALKLLRDAERYLTGEGLPPLSTSPRRTGREDPEDPHEFIPKAGQQQIVGDPQEALSLVRTQIFLLEMSTMMKDKNKGPAPPTTGSSKGDECNPFRKFVELSTVSSSLSSESMSRKSSVASEPVELQKPDPTVSSSAKNPDVSALLFASRTPIARSKGESSDEWEVVD